MSNDHVHPIFTLILNGLTVPKRITCYHPVLQINDDGVCCDCGTEVAAAILDTAGKQDRQEPKGRVSHDAR